MWKYRIPKALIFLRLFIGVLIVILSLCKIHYYQYFAISLFSLGLISDIFDGIIARKLGISSPKLRKLDSNVDQLFYLGILGATIIQCPSFFYNNLPQIIILLSCEAFAYIISFLKFKKEIASHSIAAKIWSLSIFATLIQVMIRCNSNILFEICFWLGIVSRLEIIGILFILKNWTTDIPSIFHAVKIKQGIPIKRNKLFNG